MICAGRILISVLLTVGGIHLVGAQELRQTCESLLKSVQQGFEEKGVPGIFNTAVKQYLEFTSGPYVYCYNNITKGQENAEDMVRFIHPYLSYGVAVGPPLSGNGSTDNSQANSDRQAASLDAIESCCGNLFNFTQNYDQAKSEASGSYTEGSTREYLAFSEQTTNGTYLYCACPITNVPEGERDNSNAIQLAEENPALFSLSGSVSLMHSVLFVTAMSCVSFLMMA